LIRNSLMATLVALLILPAVVYSAVRETEGFAVREDGSRIAYNLIDRVKTIPLIIVAGGPGSDTRYMRVGGALDELAKHRTVIFYDQRGIGRSADVDGTETIDQFVEDIEAVRQAVGAPAIDLLGHSFGGYLAIAYTAKHPDHVRGLIFVASPPPKIADVVQLMDQVYPDRIEAWREKRPTLNRNTIGSDIALYLTMEFVDQRKMKEYIAALSNYRFNFDVNNDLRREMATQDYWAQAREFQQRALIINGRNDAIVPPANAWALHKALHNSSLEIMEGTGHSPHFEKPAAFLAIVTPFLESLDRDGRRR
jgi:proline iminopeptidase